jgi:hypothetical protein
MLEPRDKPTFSLTADGLRSPSLWAEIEHVAEMQKAVEHGADGTNVVLAAYPNLRRGDLMRSLFSCGASDHASFPGRQPCTTFEAEQEGLTITVAR